MTPLSHPGTWRPGTGRASDDLLELPLQVVDLVAQPGRVLEAQVGGGLVHLLLERLDQARQLVVRELGEVAADLVARARPAAPAGHGRLLGRAAAWRGCR